jgi:hypothetical protein
MADDQNDAPEQLLPVERQHLLATLAFALTHDSRLAKTEAADVMASIVTARSSRASITLSSCGGLCAGARHSLLAIGWRSFFEIEDERQNTAQDEHDGDQHHCYLPLQRLALP